MWSHYADKHRGFCVGFETFISNIDTSSTPKIILDSSSLDTSVFPFPNLGTTLPDEYNELMPTISRLKQPDPSEIIKSVTRKHSSWSYEKERRIIIPKRNLVIGNQAVKFQKQILKEIIFGIKCSPDHRENIICLVGQHYPKGQVKFFECKFPDSPSNITDMGNVKYQVKIVEYEHQKN